MYQILRRWLKFYQISSSLYLVLKEKICCLHLIYFQVTMKVAVVHPTDPQMHPDPQMQISYFGIFSYEGCSVQSYPIITKGSFKCFLFWNIIYSLNKTTKRVKAKKLLIFNWKIRHFFQIFNDILKTAQNSEPLTPGFFFVFSFRTWWNSRFGITLRI